jgi:hypothetical protein
MGMISIAYLREEAEVGVPACRWDASAQSEVSKSELVRQCIDLQHCLHWLYLEPTHHVLAEAFMRILVVHTVPFLRMNMQPPVATISLGANVWQPIPVTSMARKPGEQYATLGEGGGGCQKKIRWIVTKPLKHSPPDHLLLDPPLAVYGHLPGEIGRQVPEHLLAVPFAHRGLAVDEGSMGEGERREGVGVCGCEA